MLKENSLKSLLLLYSADKNQKLLGEVSKVVAVMPETSPSGQRAMVAWWQKRGLIESFAMPEGRQVALSGLGRTTLEAELPFFQMPESWSGDWQLLILRQAPKGDKAFHALRDMVKRAGALTVSRGVYGFIHQMPLELQQRITANYSHSVSLIRVRGEDHNDLNDIALKYFHIFDQISLYSGISREADRLLTDFDSQKGLINRSKNQSLSLYGRFFALFCGDNGLMLRLLPEAPQPLQILTKLQQIILK